MGSEGLKLILGEELKGAVFGEAANSREVLKLIHQEDWDIVVLDICIGFALNEKSNSVNIKL